MNEAAMNQKAKVTFFFSFPDIKLVKSSVNDFALNESTVDPTVLTDSTIDPLI